MKKILVFTTDCKGHHLEYLHHFYIQALRDESNLYVFCVSSDFNEVKSTFSWPKAGNIIVDIIRDVDLKKCISGKNGFFNIMKLSFFKSLYIRKKCRQYNINTVYTIMLMEYLPALPFILSKSIDFRGIIYRIALNEKSLSLKSKLIENFKFKLLAKSEIFRKVFVLNDRKSVERLNDIYGVCKFCYLPDPFPRTSMPHDLRSELHIPVVNKMFLHFGGLGLRKGTITIIEAIEKIKDTKNLTFVFAGKVGDDCRDLFYSQIEKVKDKVQILVYDKFCSYDFLSSLAYTADCLLIPYQNVNQSSGVLGYAAQYDKPVIGPDAGLLGEIIRIYGLGIVISCPITAESLAKSITDAESIKPVDGKMYRESNSIENFLNIITE